PGRLFLAVRDNERASAAFGVSPATVKLAVLAVSGFFSAVAGVLWADAWKAVSPTHFTADLSMAIIAIPVIGGLGSISGAVAAAPLLYGATFFVGPHVASLFGVGVRHRRCRFRARLPCCLRPFPQLPGREPLRWSHRRRDDPGRVRAPQQGRRRLGHGGRTVGSGQRAANPSSSGGDRRPVRAPTVGGRANGRAVDRYSQDLRPRGPGRSRAEADPARRTHGRRRAA